MDDVRRNDLLASLANYRKARQKLLAALGCDESNRDPFAEFSEQLVAGLVDGELPASRVQKGWDVLAPDGARVQVRCLANPGDRWVNEHLVDFRADCDRYALVVFEALEPKTVLVFNRDNIRAVCETLGKRHPNQHECLQLTRRNYWQLLAEPERFARIGVMVHRLPSAG